MKPSETKSDWSVANILRNVAVGLIVSIVMLNLGAALGILSGRGAFAGMLSAALIAFITSAFGGTRIQGSGTTAPMSTVTAVIVAYAAEKLPEQYAGISADHFVNIVLLMTAGFLILFSVLRLGRFITYVPNLVVSGFMCGIAMIIWVLQFEVLFGVGKEPLDGNMWLNLILAMMTLILAFWFPYILKKISSKLAMFLPGTLLALMVVSVFSNVTNMPVEYLEIANPMTSMDDFAAFLQSQIPTTFNFTIFMLALPFALELAALCYIDTLLTSLIVDKMRGSQTLQNKELAAQGLATVAVGLVGGVPGAQSTVPSVLTVKEGATLRLAGICAGIFVLLEIVLLADLMQYIPQAVFVGILIKVGYDVFDLKPLLAYLRTVRRDLLEKRKSRILGHKEMILLSGTAVVTAFVDLILAVGAFSAMFYVFNKKSKDRKEQITDYVPD